VTVTALARNPLFEGLEPAELEELNWRMQPRRFAANEAICREGEPGDSLFVIADGLARVIVSDPSGDRRAVARLRRGDVIGEMSLLTGEPRSATVVAGTPTTALELGQRDFAALLADHPRILANLARILSRRLAETTTQVADRRARGEAIALLVGPASARLVPALVAAAEAASPRPVASLDARLSI
jgi:CRP-like cAMP-binding protein